MSDDERKKLRHCLGHFATGVTIVTATGPSGEPLGMTVNSFTSVSLDPPLVLFCVAHKANSHAGFKAAEGYAIHVLREDQTQLSNTFATPGADKWSNVQHRLGEAGAPIIEPHLAVMECKPHAVFEGGDHDIIVARIVRHEIHPETSTPLLFFRGGYGALSTPEGD